MTNQGELSANSFSEGLSRIDRYLGQLQQLPSVDAFKEAIESALWREITEQSDPPSEVRYSELPDISHSLIGQLEIEGKTVDPWWLREFDWKAEFGGEELTLRGDAIESFVENFDRDRTVIKKPSFSEKKYNTQHRTLLFANESLHDIRSELENHIDGDSSDSFPKLPGHPFQIEEGRVVLSDRFDEWIESFLELMPALGSEATALYLANTRTSSSALESVLDDELFHHLDRLGIAQEQRYNQVYVNKYNCLLRSTTIANRTIPTDGNTELSGLQYQLYRGFLGTYEPSNDYTVSLFDNATKRTPAKLDDGEVGLFTRVSCGSPVILSNSQRPKIMSLSIYSVNTSGKAGYQNKQYRAVRRLFEQSDWFE